MRYTEQVDAGSFHGEVAPDYAARKYTGAVASGYDAKRQESPKWHAENERVHAELEDFMPGDRVLDVPVGTGRFLEMYEEKGFSVTGVDISVDMMVEAAQKGDGHTELQTGDVRKLEFKDDEFEVSIMCRLTRWLSPEDRIKALKELQRVTTKRILFTARVANHPHAYPYTEIDKALDGWSIVRNHGIGDDDDYRLIVLEPS